MHLQSLMGNVSEVKCMKIPVRAHKPWLMYTRINKYKSESVHKHWSFHTYMQAKYTIEHIFTTWPLQEYVQQLQITQKRHLTEHEHFAAFGKIFLCHLLEKLLERKNKQLSKERKPLKHQSHLEKQWRAVSWNIPLCGFWISWWILLSRKLMECLRTAQVLKLLYFIPSLMRAIWH